MRRLTFTVAVAAVLLPLLSPTASAVATATSATNEADPDNVQQVGPGLYFTDTDTFKISDTDVPAGAIGRSHGVATGGGDLARPQSALASRPEMAVFGPGWTAEFLGGMVDRKLETQNGAIVVTELDGGTTARYDLKSSISFPDGGGVQRYESTDGSKITETTRWDATAGAMRTSITETIAMDKGATEAGDDTFTQSNADLSLTYTWNKIDGLQGTDTWRATSTGNTAYGTSSVTYDPQGRISTIKEPAGGETPEETLTIHYATTTTATSASFGDFAGRLKDITLTSGSSTPQTVAQYGYDPNGLLRTVADPGLSSSPASTYGYDQLGRLTSIDSPTDGSWQLAFANGTAAPTATATGTAQPTPGDPMQGATGINDPNATEPSPGDFLPGDISNPQAYPSYCNDAWKWLYYQRAGCSSWVAHNGWHKPLWKKLPSKRYVVGITFDHCTNAPDRPAGFDFRPACDMHDYGYGLIGNTYKHYKYYLDRYRKSQVDDVFYSTLKNWTCNAYFILVRPVCRRWAFIYRQGVRLGNPKNGADKT
ncbi:phospholipase A2 [Nonomuraea sp. NPDC049158]|uniref:phospholipase A2 n=1 Tax=Nonomuraea sp. NPDC049158 TaxID=3155649 RepID=UPI0033E2B50E